VGVWEHGLVWHAHRGPASPTLSFRRLGFSGAPESDPVELGASCLEAPPAIVAREGGWALAWSGTCLARPSVSLLDATGAEVSSGVVEWDLHGGTGLESLTHQSALAAAGADVVVAGGELNGAAGSSCDSRAKHLVRLRLGQDDLYHRYGSRPGSADDRVAFALAEAAGTGRYGLAVTYGRPGECDVHGPSGLRLYMLRPPPDVDQLGSSPFASDVRPEHPALAWGLEQRAFALVWDDLRDDPRSVWLALVDEEATRLADDILLSRGDSPAFGPQVAAGAGRFAAVWTDEREGTPQVYMRIGAFRCAPPDEG